MNPVLWVRWGWVLGMLLACGVSAGAQEAAPQAEEQDQRVNIDHADRMRYDGQKKLFFLTGNVRMTHQDATLFCDQAEYNEDADTARAVGHLRVTSPENNLTGDLVTADFGRKLIVITGNVHLVTQRKPKEQPAAGAEATPAPAGPPPAAPPAEPTGQAETPASERPERFRGYQEKLTTITCERIDYWYDEKRLIATGNVKAVQEDKTVTADDAVYEEELDRLVLTGNPVRVVMKNGNQFETPKATISVEEDWVEAETVRAVMQREEEGKTSPPKTPEGQSAPQPEQPAGPP